MSRHRQRRRRGASATEFALLLPFLVTITSITIDWSMYFRQRTVLVGAVSQGALVAAGVDDRNGQDPTVIGVATAEEVWADGGVAGEASFSLSQSGSEPSIMYTVTGKTAFEPFVGFVSFTPDTVVYSTTMRKSRQ